MARVAQPASVNERRHWRVRPLMVLLGICALFAGPTSVGAPEPAQLPSADSVYDDSRKLIETRLRETMARYDDAVEAAPDDFQLRLARCRYIGAFLDFEDFYLEAADDALAACHDELDQRFPGHPEVALARLEWLYGREALDYAQSLMDAGLRAWNNAQQARLYLSVSDNLEYSTDDTSRAGRYCVMALALDMAADCRLSAARYHNSLGRDAQAIEVLASSLDPNDEPYHLTQKAILLFDYGATGEATAMYRRIAATDEPLYNVVELARRLADAGLVDEALEAMDRAQASDWNQLSIARTRFSIAMMSDDSELALRRYNEWRDMGARTDPLLRNRLALAIKDPTLEWRGRDLAGVGGLAVVVLALALASLLVPALVHYRGLARWTNGLNPATNESQWTLRHAWAAMFLLALAGFVALYVADYGTLASLVADEANTREQSNLAAANAKVLESLLLAIGLAPLLLMANRWRVLGPGNWSVLRCVVVAVGVAVVFRVLFGAFGLALNDQPDPGLGQVLTTTRMFVAMGAEYGLIATLLFAAALIPLVEEVVFRGILLQGFSRHLSAGGANLLQSTMFAAVHEALVFFPLYVAFGYALGAVSRRSGGLLAAMLIHALFNAGAVVATLWAEARLLGG